MQRFRFNLEPALDLRRRAEEQAQIVVADHERRVQEAQRQLEELVRDQQRQEQYRADLQRAKVDVQLLSEADRYSDALARTRVRQQDKVGAALQALQGARAVLQERRREREALEKLRERRLAEHHQEQQRQEQHSLDEAGILRWRSA